MLLLRSWGVSGVPDNKYIRQLGFFDPDKHQPHVIVVGAGSLGSHIVYGLAKMGVVAITVIDGDVVAEHNVSNQLYSAEDVGKPKVSALHDKIIDLCGQGIEAVPVMVEKWDDLPSNCTGYGKIIILCTDSVKSRKLVYELVKDFPMFVVDVRAGGEGYSVQALSLQDEHAKNGYEKSFEGKFSKAKCGEETVIYNVTAAAAEAVAIVKGIATDSVHVDALQRSMKSARVIGR